MIPAFNRRRFLKRAIDSVLAQTGVAFHLTVVDDGSTDDLSELRKKVEGEGHRWLSRRTNGGPAAARNDGAASTDTAWIAFLDSDDEWGPTKLERQWNWHRDHPRARLSQVRETWIRNGAAVNKPARWEPEEGDLFADSVERCAIGPSCVMMRRDLWEESGGFDERYRVCEDYELWLRVARSDAVGLVPGAALVRKHGGHPDQLSTTTPALDRYRVVALLECWLRGGLSEERREAVEDGIRRKAGILAQGASKRGLEERAAFYGELAGTDLKGLGAGLDPVLHRARELADMGNIVPSSPRGVIC
ncbi:MAG: glycosyltransferase family A protein [Verrucomicrobiales bacterium]